MPLARIVLYAGMGVMVVALGRSLLIGPLPLPAAALALLMYGALLALGGRFIRLRMFADARLAGPRSARGVALTFDGGPDPDMTPRLLDLLEGAHARVTFFVSASAARRHPDLVGEIVRRGHAVGLGALSDDSRLLFRTGPSLAAAFQEALSSLTPLLPAPPALFRPPSGHTSPAIARLSEEHGLIVVGWSCRATLGRNGRGGMAAITTHLRDGAIVALLLASGTDSERKASLEALSRLLDLLDRERLPAIALTEWFTEGDGSQAPKGSETTKRAPLA